MLVPRFSAEQRSAGTGRRGGFTVFSHHVMNILLMCCSLNVFVVNLEVDIGWFVFPPQSY